ncbi:MAG: zinc-binding dehydrogenase [Planctomycetes bacterium]|nr:zinc-binding dehydrogenase [Planctomycetota bacterium]
MESLPGTMLAARVHPAEGLRIEEVPLPKVSDKESMLVRIRCCAVCNGSDWLHIRDHSRPTCTHPFVLGHEASGDVAQIGEGVEGFALGDRVTFWCATGSFAEYNRIRPRGLAMGKLPEGMTYEQGAITQLVCAVLRGIHSADIREGDKVLVLGQGPVGLLATQCALAYGADLVVATDMLPNRLALAKTLGAALTIHAKQEDFVARIREEVGEVNVVFDGLGDDRSPGKDAMARSMEVMARRGRYLMFGMSDEPRSFNVRTLYGRNLRIVTTDSTDEEAQALMEKACALVADGTIDVTSFITHRFPLRDLPQALDLVLHRPQDVVKAVVNIPE